MPDFDKSRQTLRAARVQVEQTSARARADAQHVAQLDQRAQLLLRREGEDSATLKALRTEQARAKTKAEKSRADLGTATKAEAELEATFATWTDPRTGVRQLDDRIPLFMMPVRLETRFRPTTPPNAAVLRYDLLVRIFPDDCWLDTFEPTLTEKEVASARTFWADTFAAGGIESEERAAWVILARKFGSGRASWIADTHTPNNLVDKPSKEPGDVILTVVTSAPLEDTERAHIATYWEAIWRGQADASLLAIADQTLEAAVGEARALVIRTDYQPVNLDTAYDPAATVRVSFVDFDEVETKQLAWAQAPRLRVMPERFVFVGYRKGLEPLVVVGKSVPNELIAGPDPSLPEDEQLKHEDDGSLRVPKEIRWLFDFDAAVDVGMGFRIPIEGTQAKFDRILVTGIRLRSDPQEAKEELETLFKHHQFTRNGFGLLPQGTPTNNTESADAGFELDDRPELAFEARKQVAFTSSANWLDKKDGEWLAQYLGLDPDLFLHTRDAGGSDQLTQRALNTALWPGTLGYWMQTMMAPVFDNTTVDGAREYFTRHVLGAGAVPSIRIGAQPYGILPTTSFSRMAWTTARGANPFVRSLHKLLNDFSPDLDLMTKDVPYVGNGEDPHQTLLSILGLHSRSVEWRYRIGEDFDAVVERLKLQGIEGGIEAAVMSEVWRLTALRLFALGYGEDEELPRLMNLVFERSHRLSGGLVDDRPVSEDQPLRPQTDDGKNYITWLLEAARQSLDTLYRQDGFENDRPPRALLYIFIRHALQLGFHDTSLKLHEVAGTLAAAEVTASRTDPPFIHIGESTSPSSSRYAPMLKAEPAITGSNQVSVADHIAKNIDRLRVASFLPRQLEALERLQSQPTAKLARAFGDHVDTLAYRADAWWLSLVHYQLAEMRNLRDAQETDVKTGVHLGAFGWLEDLAPEGKLFTPVQLGGRDGRSGLQASFGTEPLLRDPTNQGYVHAPSLNHAVTAAVLRNAYNSSESEETRDAAAINLTSTRVRTAVALIEGLRNGQGLSDLLGYMFERGLHDRGGIVEVDKFIYKLRKAFPLVGDKIKVTQTSTDQPIEDIAANNVIDGLALVEHMVTSGNKTYPFGKSLPAASGPEADAINEEAERLLDARDAVADLALAEGVHQAVQGNYERVASNYDAYARGEFPPEPDVVRTPFEGIGITHRVGLHLPTNVSATESEVAGLAMTPRALAQPELNAWLGRVLPPLVNVGCEVDYVDASGAEHTTVVTLQALGLQPIDLLYVLDNAREPSMSELDDRVERVVRARADIRLDSPMTIRFLASGGTALSVFQLLPLMRALRELVKASRPLRPTDVMLMNQASSSHDEDVTYDAQRLVRASGILGQLIAEIQAFGAGLSPSPEPDVEAIVGQVSNLLARAAHFSVDQAGWSFAHGTVREISNLVLSGLGTLLERFETKLAKFDELLIEYAELPTDASEDVRKRRLLTAELSVTMEPTDPTGVTSADLASTVLPAKRAAFVARRDAFAQAVTAPRSRLADLLTDVRALLPVLLLPDDSFSLAPVEEAIARFVDETSRVIEHVLGELIRKRTESDAAVTMAQSAVSSSKRIEALNQAGQAMFGADFKVVPSIGLGPQQSSELEQAAAQGASGELFDHLDEDFPVDTWLYGAARVRPKMLAWERLLSFTAAVGRDEPELSAMQLPFTPGDRWVGLDLAPEQQLTHDRLLYTAHFSEPLVPEARQVGLLLDEWTEVIPGKTTDSGLVFHHDRPNSEAPQAMLLVTPSDYRNGWEWADVVGALNDTLDMARRRGIEPDIVDQTAYAALLPATIAAAQARQLTIAANLALNNAIELKTVED